MHSATFLLQRLVLAIPTLIGVAVIVFVLLRVVPGDPIAMMTPPGADTDDIARLRALYGLDLPILDQFLIWAGELLQGDFGTSISLRQNVLWLILGRLPATLELCFAALLLAAGLGVGLALAGAYWRGSWPELVVDGVVAFVQAIPDFLWGLVLILTLGVLVPILPISGQLDPRTEFAPVTQFYLLESLLTGRLDVFGAILTHLVLPATALALPLVAMLARVLKASLIEAMTQDYTLLARVKGFGPARILVRHALRNAAVPALALTAVQFTFLVGGTVLIERIFGYPGIGNMAIDAVINRDLPLLQGLVLTFAVLFITVNLLVDLSYVALNPRLRHG